MHWKHRHGSPRPLLTFLPLLLVLVATRPSAGAEPVAWWTFDGKGESITRDRLSGGQDSITGNFRQVDGVSGSALKLDGFTTDLTRKAPEAPELGESFSIEAWLALGAYPWNWCPIVQQGSGEEAGYRFAVGPEGELALELALDGKWQVCRSEPAAIPLGKWVHVAGTFDGSGGLAVYADGKQLLELPLKGRLTPAPDADLRIGMGPRPQKPSHIHREFGTLPGWYSLDGIIDELKIHGHALKPEQVQHAHDAVGAPGSPDLPPRKLPSGPPGPSPFGAVYCRLKYYEEWDALWAVDKDPDVLVRFDQTAARVVFWRGSRYSPAWVSENGHWMADQSVEAWNKVEGCFEHMQDRLCRYSHVRIIESHDARVVVHWRYAPVSAYNHLWRENEKTGRACWVDEYYTVYPDAMGIRKPTWKKGTLLGPRQFQESLPFTQPGQISGDVVEVDFCTVANLEGESAVLSFVENPAKKKEGLPDELTIQRYNFRARNDPFIIFEVGNKMHYVTDRNIRGLSRPGACNHWPVGQARCDGRTSRVSDRPTHFLGFPISDPPVHEKDGRCWWNGLYGMTERPMEYLVGVARSWNHPPELKLASGGFSSQGYDRGQRAYVLQRDTAEEGAPLKLELGAGKSSPLFHPAFVIRNWGPGTPAVEVDGKVLPRGKDLRLGHRRTLEGTDIIIWMQIKSTEPVQMTLQP